ncbi:MAG: hypothetical protein HFJ59_07275, partial [Clostridia bacterium]|nr:hypothetical protein [Clostridia bacterium]
GQPGLNRETLSQPRPPPQKIFKIINKNKKIYKKNKYKINTKIINYQNEENIIENNKKYLKEELNKIKENLKNKNILEKQKIISDYENYIDNNKINYFFKINNLDNINYEIDNNLQLINDKTLKLHTLNLERKNIKEKLENLSIIQEEIADLENKKKDLQYLDFSMNLAKDVLRESYEKMKNSITPKFTQKLSSNISEITNKKYNNVIINENEGLMIELENGDYVQANRLSIGTIEQLYMSLRISIIDNLSEETVPILLDETFAFYDNKRLENILNYFDKKMKDKQIIIFTCTKREKEILEKNNIVYNYLEL